VDGHLPQGDDARRGRAEADGSSALKRSRRGGADRFDWLASLLRAYRDYRGLFEDWGYWAPGKGSSLEVDFVLRRGRDLVAVEVRSGQRVFETDLRGLRAIAELLRVRRRLVVCRGDRRQKTADGIEILPIRPFLDELEASSLLP
jgi:hypothetical protein